MQEWMKCTKLHSKSSTYIWGSMKYTKLFMDKMHEIDRDKQSTENWVVPLHKRNICLTGLLWCLNVWILLNLRCLSCKSINLKLIVKQTLISLLCIVLVSLLLTLNRIFFCCNMSRVDKMTVTLAHLNSNSLEDFTASCNYLAWIKNMKSYKFLTNLLSGSYNNIGLLIFFNLMFHVHRFLWVLYFCPLKTYFFL